MSSTAESQSEKVEEEKVVVHKYPDFPYCIDFFDGQCWACTSDHVLNLIINKCVMAQTQKVATILEKEQSNQPVSTTPDKYCNIYSEEEGRCQECFRNYYYDSSA